MISFEHVSRRYGAKLAAGGPSLGQPHLSAPLFILSHHDFRFAGVADVTKHVPLPNRPYSRQQGSPELRARCKAFPLCVKQFGYSAPADGQTRFVQEDLVVHDSRRCRR